MFIDMVLVMTRYIETGVVTWSVFTIWYHTMHISVMHHQYTFVFLSTCKIWWILWSMQTLLLWTLQSRLIQWHMALEQTTVKGRRRYSRVFIKISQPEITASKILQTIRVMTHMDQGQSSWWLSKANQTYRRSCWICQTSCDRTNSWFIHNNQCILG